MPSVSWKSIEGKTIKRIRDKLAINIIRIEFDDGSYVTVDTEAIQPNLYRPVLFSKENI